MVEEIQKAKKTTTTYKNNLTGSNDKIKNSVKKIKEKMLGEIMANANRLCDWFELHHNV